MEQLEQYAVLTNCAIFVQKNVLHFVIRICIINIKLEEAQIGMKSHLDKCVCPGCGEILPSDNSGCGNCGYEDGAVSLSNVSSGFLKEISESSIKDALMY